MRMLRCSEGVMRKVYPAQPFSHGALGSFGKGSYVLLRQHQFPDTYDERDKLQHADHDRLLSWDREHASACIKRHTGTGPMGLGTGHGTLPSRRSCPS